MKWLGNAHRSHRVVLTPDGSLDVFEVSDISHASQAPDGYAFGQPLATRYHSFAALESLGYRGLYQLEEAAEEGVLA